MDGANVCANGLVGPGLPLTVTVGPFAALFAGFALSSIRNRGDTEYTMLLS